MALPDPTTAQLDARFRQIVVGTFPSEPERKRMEDRRAHSWVHIRPDAVLVQAMGNHWAPGSWNRVVDMVMETNKQGVCCWLEEAQDRCFQPYDAMGTMRNEAWMKAQYGGFEWLLYIDCDVLPKPDALLRLLNWDLPVVAPIVFEPEIGRQLSGPEVKEGTGIVPAKWTVLSMLLFRVSVLRPFHGMFWSDALGADEGWHFQRLWSETGHRPYIDTTTRLEVYKRPTYPLATNRMTWEQRVEFWKLKLDKLMEPPDRKAIDPYSSDVEAGEYMPFLKRPMNPAMQGVEAPKQTSDGTVGDGAFVDLASLGRDNQGPTEPTAVIARKEA